MAGSVGRRALEQWASVPAAPAGSLRHHAARQRRRCRCTLELNELCFLCVISFHWRRRRTAVSRRNIRRGGNSPGRQWAMHAVRAGAPRHMSLLPLQVAALWPPAFPHPHHPVWGARVSLRAHNRACRSTPAAAPPRALPAGKQVRTGACTPAGCQECVQGAPPPNRRGRSSCRPPTLLPPAAAGPNCRPQSRAP